MNANPITLQGLLDKYKNTNGKEITHTKIGDPKNGIYGGKYSIPDEEMNNFWKLYYKHVYIDNKDSHLVEAQLQGKGPILVDIDERYSSEIRVRQHSDDHVIDLIELYCESIKNYIEWDSNTFEVNPKVYFLEKKNANTNNEEYTKDGIHLVFDLCLPYGVQMAIRADVLNNIADIFEDLPLINSYDDLVDSRISSGINKWQIFGSKKPNNEAYDIKKIYEIVVNEDDDIELHNVPYNKKDIVKILPNVSARNRDAHPVVLTDDALEIAKKYDTIKQKKRTKISSSGETKSNLFTVSSFDTIDTPEKCKFAIDKILEIAKKNDEYDIIMAHDMTKLLNEDYYEPFDKWMEVGWALKSTNELLYPVWLGFSSRSDKFDWVNNDCYHIWNTQMTWNGSLTLGSLCYWAKCCNPTAYNSIRGNSIDYYLNKTIDGETEYDVARLVFALYQGKYACTNIRNKIWYHFTNGRWQEIDSGTTLRHHLSKEIHQLYANKIQNLISTVNDTEAGSDEAKNLRTLIDKLSKMALKLKKTSWKQNIMRECCELFFDSEFLNELDKNTQLLCFKNGVLDIGKQCFRKCEPNDYLSLCTNTNYIEMDENNDEHCIIRDEILTFMDQLFPDRELNNYMWSHLASVLVGDNKNQTFNIYNGCGRNGKSVLVELMGVILGDYKATVPLTLITQKRTSIGGVSPEVAGLKGTRYAVMQEPSKGTKLNEGVMKELTGGDPIQGRALFKDVETFVPQFSLVVCTNHLPEINSSDDGTWRRIRVCNYKSKFVINPSPNPKDYEFKIDKNINKNFERWAPIFTSMLVNRLFETKGIVEDCDAVLAPTQKYKSQQDHFTGFMSERIVKKAGCRIKKRDVLNEFQEWFTELHGGKVPSGKELYEYLTKQLGEPTRLGWKGWKLYHAHDLVDDMDIEPNSL